MRKIQVINQVRGVLLASEPSGFIKQLIAVSSLSIAPSETTPKPIKAEKSGKLHNQKQTSLADKLEPLEKRPSKGTSVKPAQPKSEEFSLPKRQFVAEASITQKPAKQKTTVDAISKPSTAQHSPPCTPSGSQAVITLIDHLRKSRPVPKATTADNSWCSVEESDITLCLQQHPGLKRSVLLREMANHPDCRIDEGCFYVRIDP
jgi:hypothetical protein